MLTGKKIYFAGAGHIAESMIKGLLAAPRVTPAQLTVGNRNNQNRLSYLQSHYGVNIALDKAAAIKQADIIFLAMKPQDIFSALAEIQDLVNAKQLIISVAAGIPTDLIEKRLALTIPVVRAMPNTSCAVLESATALAGGAFCSPDHIELARQVFLSVGSAVVVEEVMLNAVTGLSGSGPAYVYYMVEALEKAGVQAGIPREIARQLVLKTIIGSAHMLMETGEKPETLREQVTSPNGTTMAGIQELDKGNFQQTIKLAVLKATRRAHELGQSLIAAVK